MINTKNFLVAAAFCLISYTSVAAEGDSWTLINEDSRLSFVSIKVKDLAEIHYFEQISGTVTMDGKVSLSIDPESINTGIEIRDDRMKEFLFKVVEFPSIGVTANVDMKPVKALADGKTLNTSVDAELNIMGLDVPVKADLLVTRAGDTLRVSTAKPIIVTAAALGLTDGVAKLAELAGGIDIGYGVPVFFSLSFAN